MTGGQDDKAYVWSTVTGELILLAADDKESIIFSDFSFDDQYLATGDMNGLIRVRKTSDWSIVWSNDTMGDTTVSHWIINRIGFIPLFACTKVNVIQQWMQWHPQAHVIVAGSESGELYLWKIPDGECKIVQGFGQKPDVCCIMPDGKIIFF